MRSVKTPHSPRPGATSSTRAQIVAAESRSWRLTARKRESSLPARVCLGETTRRRQVLLGHRASSTVPRASRVRIAGEPVFFLSTRRGQNRGARSTSTDRRPPPDRDKAAGTGIKTRIEAYSCLPHADEDVPEVTDISAAARGRTSLRDRAGGASFANNCRLDSRLSGGGALVDLSLGWTARRVGQQRNSRQAPAQLPRDDAPSGRGRHTSGGGC